MVVAVSLANMIMLEFESILKLYKSVMKRIRPKLELCGTTVFLQLILALLNGR